MGNRFSTMTQYHSIIRAHAVMAILVFLFVLPFSIMMARFYSRRPGWAVKYHAQLNIFAGLLLLAVFILGYFAVGLERSLTNPHHGIGVAIFVMVVVQLLGGGLIRKITKSRSLRIMIHQWLGRATAILGIVQIPLGLTLYGSPLWLFICYAVWMAILVLIYFVLSYRSAGRRELYMDGPRSEIGRSEVTRRTRLTESEYFASDHETERPPSGKAKWLGPLAAGAGLWALMRGRKKNQDRGSSLSRSPSVDPIQKPEVIASRHGSASYLSEKYSDLPPPKKSGGGFGRLFGGAAAGFGVGKLVSGLMNRREKHYDDEYSAVSTETPKRHRAGRATTATDLSSELTEDTRFDGTRTSLIPPSGNRAAAMADARSAADSRLGSQRPITPRPSHTRRMSRRTIDDSDYSSYVSPSRRPIDDQSNGGGGGGFGGGILGGLGMGWLAKKLADRRARKDEERRLRDEEDMRSMTEMTGVTGYTDDTAMSPPGKYSRRPPARRHTDTVLSSELTESSVEGRPPGNNFDSRKDNRSKPPIVPVQRGSRSRSRSTSKTRSRNRHSRDHVSMPDMPDDPRGVLRPDSDISYGSPDGRPRRNSSRRRRDGDRAAAEAAARAGDLADEEGSYIEGRERYASPSSAPVSVKLKVHDDKDRNVTLRRLTEEEAMAARGRRGSDSSLDSPSYSRRHYRRDSSQRRAESAAERRAEEQDQVPALNPPNPAFSKGKDSAYYSGAVGHLGSVGNVAGGKAGSSVMGSMASLAQSHGTWSEMSDEPTARLKPSPSAAADNRRRRRMERRRGSSTDRPSGTEMFD